MLIFETISQQFFCPIQKLIEWSEWVLRPMVEVEQIQWSVSHQIRWFKQQKFRSSVFENLIFNLKIGTSVPGDLGIFESLNFSLASSSIGLWIAVLMNIKSFSAIGIVSCSSAVICYVESPRVNLSSQVVLCLSKLNVLTQNVSFWTQ